MNDLDELLSTVQRWANLQRITVNEALARLVARQRENTEKARQSQLIGHYPKR